MSGLHKLNSEEAVDKEIYEKGKSTFEKIEKTLTEELVIGICATIGSSKDPVIETLQNTLDKKYGYTVKHIRLSEFISKYTENGASTEDGKTPGFTSLMNKIKGGNQLREKYGNDVLANLAIKKINIERIQPPDRTEIDPIKIEDLKSRRICYIVNSIKNFDELKLLRSVYRELFYVFSIFSPKQERESNLSKKYNLSPEEIKLVIEKDEYENDSYGQNVRKTFKEADFFVRISLSGKSADEVNTEVEQKVERYFNLIFENKIVTPLKNEIAMYQAKSAAGNSACLSRQVGACIVDQDGNVISKGWNDVPKFGGNLYVADDNAKDHRCFNTGGICRNDQEKDKVATEIILLISTDTILQKIDGFKTVIENSDTLDRIKELIRNDSKIKDLIEFSRSVHAEMHAIINGSQLAGAKMVGGKLFTTTYPCHNCARHIISAGIKEVYFIEPYVKSLCLELHYDAITEDESSMDKVKILMYDGVAPRRFLEFFILNKDRKAKGKIIDNQPHKIYPKSRLTLQALATLEAQATHSLDETNFFDENSEA